MQVHELRLNLLSVQSSRFKEEEKFKEEDTVSDSCIIMIMTAEECAGASGDR